MGPLVLEKGVEERNYQQIGKYFVCVFFFKPLLSQGKKFTCILRKIRVYVRHRSFDVCRDVLKY